MTRILREPVLHFAVLAVVLFAWFSAVSDPAPAGGGDSQIEIDEAVVGQIVSQYRSVWNRDPTREELSSLVENSAREEVMVREALALGLDRGDAVIRNRLRQKMQFLTDSAAQAMEPGDDILRAYLDENADRFMDPSAAGFTQVFLNQDAGEEAVATVLNQLQSGADPLTLGERSLLSPETPLAAAAQVDAAYGNGFFSAISDLPVGRWAGPVRSGYGLHLVRINEFRPAKLPDFETIRGKVLFDWRRTQAQMLADAQYDALRSRHDVVLPDQAVLDRALGQ